MNDFAGKSLAELRQAQDALRAALSKAEEEANSVYEDKIDEIYAAVVDHLRAIDDTVAVDWRKNEQFVKVSYRDHDGSEGLKVSVYHVDPSGYWGVPGDCVTINDSLSGADISFKEPPAPYVVVNLVKALMQH